MSNSLSRIFSVEDMAQLARRCLPRSVYDFYAGGAEDERTLRANLQAFENLTLVTRVLTGSGSANTATSILGAASAMPLAIAPMGAVGFGRRDGDAAMARAAASAGIPYILSTTATMSIEDLAASACGRLWFQLYAFKQKERSLQLVQRAKEAGYEALVVTVDVPVGGKRERDLRNDFAMPFRFTARNLLDFSSRPRWALDMLVNGIPALPNLSGLAGPVAVETSSVGGEFDPAFNWEDLKLLRKKWPGKLVLKGILHPGDALLAADAGCDAVVVSNHGGRQLDGAASSMAGLPQVCDRVGKRMEVFVDGGIRRGSDIAKAVASGATAVLIGRPALYGACAAGEAGVAQVLKILREELARTMVLCGVPDVAGLVPDLLSSPPGKPQHR
jgi:(S)-mandelate dehydrogenase